MRAALVALLAARAAGQPLFGVVADKFGTWRVLALGAVRERRFHIEMLTIKERHGRMWGIFPSPTLVLGWAGAWHSHSPVFPRPCGRSAAHY